MAARPGSRPARLVRPVRGRGDRRQRLVGGGRDADRQPADGAHPAARRQLPALGQQVLHDRHDLRRVGRRLRQAPAGGSRAGLRDRDRGRPRARGGHHRRLGRLRPAGHRQRHDDLRRGARARRARAAVRRALPVPDRALPAEPAGRADRYRQGGARRLRRARAQPRPQLLPRQHCPGPRRPAGAGPDRRGLRRGVRRRGDHAAGGRDDPGGRRPRSAGRGPARAGGGGQRAGGDRVLGRAGGAHPARPGPDDRPVRHPRRVGHGADQGPGPALAQRAHGGLAQPPHPQGAGGRRSPRERHSAAVRVGDRPHRRARGPACHGVVGSTGPATPRRLAGRSTSSNVY